MASSEACMVGFRGTKLPSFTVGGIKKSSNNILKTLIKPGFFLQNACGIYRLENDKEGYKGFTGTNQDDPSNAPGQNKGKQRLK